MASEQAIAVARDKILQALAECDPLNITVDPLILCLMAGFKSTDSKSYRIAVKRLRDEGIIRTSSQHVELTNHGKTVAPRAEPPSNDAEIQAKLLSLLTSPSKGTMLPSSEKTTAVFNQLLDGGAHTLESLATTAGYKAAKPMDSKAFRNLIGRMKKFGMLEEGSVKGTRQFTDLVFPVLGRPQNGTPTVSESAGATSPPPVTSVDDNANVSKPSPLAALPSLSTSSNASREDSKMPPLLPDSDIASMVYRKRLTLNDNSESPRKKACKESSNHMPCCETEKTKETVTPPVLCANMPALSTIKNKEFEAELSTLEATLEPKSDDTKHSSRNGPTSNHGASLAAQAVKYPMPCKKTGHDSHERKTAKSKYTPLTKKAKGKKTKPFSISSLFSSKPRV